jgi:hypothetical protein
MPEAVESGSRERQRRITLNTDGNRHPLQNFLTAFTLVIGLVAFATGIVVRLHSVASFCGVIAFVVGLYAQLISATREERILIMGGVIAAFVGMALGIAHGGFI